MTAHDSTVVPTPRQEVTAPLHQGETVLTDRPEAANPAHAGAGDTSGTGTGNARRPLWFALEVLASVATAVAFLAWSRNIDVDPLDRKGQVSGLAALQFRFAVVAIVVVAALVVAHRLLDDTRRKRAVTIGCAVIAGLTTGLVAGGIDVALRGTQWGLWAGGGDYSWILDWVSRMQRGEAVPNHYPPVIFWLIRGWAKLSDQPAAYAIKEIQLVGTALFGPAAYLAWRLVLRPVWALGIGVVAMLPFIEPVKPYPQITLVMLMPVLVSFLQLIRRSATLSTRRAIGLGVAFGGGLGLLFLLYSGWFVWCAPGAAAAFLLLAPWRRGWAKVLTVGTSALVSMILVSWVHLRGLLSDTGGTSDNYFYFDTNTEPTYFAMWRNDRPADVGPVWPPLGELGGVGLFTIFLAVGLGLALWFGWRRTVVATIGLSAVSSWLLRMWLASEQWETLTVRLYPRTTMILLYCMLLLAGFGVLFAFTALRERLRASPLLTPVTGGRAGAGVPIGIMFIPLLLVLASAGSATANHYMPDSRRDSTGYFAWIAQTRWYPHEKTCSAYGRLHDCGTSDRSTSPAAVNTPPPSPSVTPTPTPATASQPAPQTSSGAPARRPSPSSTATR
ncbi:galactan 5-O-arabinofuranosyltransferase [Micromonospora pisi]|uniref:Galactan 5-O-arabinofuranosyltransferase n=1 Tax=Micromonospora pisi TaxID=589240 RepID=A0A495JFN0_9ACTN|nr:hypothetical protein [Micromonospora pisi]RKR87172.1 galactan 5-O-arabinofuranosyltransferase [Micromonospora pisi]